MERKDLIEYVEEIASKTKLKNILSDRDSGKFIIGKKQFRTMADISQKAKYYEEIKLMLEYKTAKGNGWDLQITNNDTCGEVFLEYIEKIKNNTPMIASANNDTPILNNISLFFGYMFWKATVLINEKNSNDRNKLKGGN